MKNTQKIVFVLTMALVSSGVACSSVSAQEVVASKPEKAIEAQGLKKAEKTTDATVTTTTAATNAESTVETQAPQEKTKKDKTKDGKGKISAQEHRSVVANFVQSLLAIADREGGIGQEVRAIAQAQNETKDRAGDLINAIENRSSLKTFFIGTSYKNIGELRSQEVQTRNQLDQLKKLSQRAENEQDKAELTTQIQTLEQQQAGINDFIAKNESKFSLFGWAVKIFRK